MSTTSCTYLETVVNAVLHLGASEDAIYELIPGGKAALANKSARFASDVLIHVLNTASAITEDPDIGLKAGMRLRPESFVDVGYALTFCENLQEALELNYHYQILTQEIGRTKLTVDNAHASVSWFPHEEHIELHRQFVDMIFSGYATIGRWLLYGKEDPIIEMRFRHAAPKNVETYELLFGDTLVFGAERDVLVMPKSLVEVPLAGRNAEMKQLLLRRLDRQLEAAGKPQSFEQQTLHILQATLADGRPRIPDIAEMMGMSERSFRRRLVSEGITFRDILEKARREACEVYLRKPDMSHSHISYALGYRDQSSYTRAFKSWFGITPREYRSDIDEIA